MKSKKITKKLSLNKKTVADLNHGELKNAHGGIGLSRKLSDCPPCYPTHTEDYTCPNTCASCDPTQNENLCTCPFVS